MSQEALISPINEWLVDQALGTNDIVEMFDIMCTKLAGVGIPINRARVIWPTLHPLFQAETVIWDQGEPARLEQFEHQDQASDAWNRSALKYVIEHRLEVLRRELTGPNENLDFEMLKDLKEEGFTDYLVLATQLEGTSFRHVNDKESRGVLVTWASNKPGGFSADDLKSLQKVQRRFAVACKTVIQSRISNNIASTYLGDRAGRYVQSGQIRRGDGQKTSAVVWYSDLRNSTSLADTMAAEDYFALLNSYFETAAEPVVEAGGEILDFIGDAVLAIFPYEGKRELNAAARAANNALRNVLARDGDANADRERQGLERFKFGVGLNVGDVMFGNIGIPSRLAFSVIGPTVNEVARIETMTKYLQQPILAGSRIAELTPEAWKSVGEHKLEGVLEPMELFSFVR